MASYSRAEGDEEYRVWQISVFSLHECYQRSKDMVLLKGAV
jgi:hypothetical protein